jgi:hypothetical protein
MDARSVIASLGTYCCGISPRFTRFPVITEVPDVPRVIGADTVYTLASAAL